MKKSLRIIFVLVLVNLGMVCMAQKLVDVQMPDPCDLTSIQDRAGQLDFSIYPNPNNGIFQLLVNIDGAPKLKVTIEIINLMGSIVNTRYCMIEDGRYDMADLELPPGIYYLRLLDNRQSYVKMFVVQ